MFCSNCGEELPENAYFCLKCGARTRKGAEAGISPLWKEHFKKEISKIEEEVEKTISIASKETEKALKAMRDEIRETTLRKPLVCSHCGERNFANARFCHKYGKKLK